MKRILRVVVFVLASAVWFGGFAIGGAPSADAESTGCAAINALPNQNLSFVKSDDYDLATGETIGAVVAQNQAGAHMVVDSVEVSTVGNAGGTLSYVIPADGNYNVAFAPLGVDTDADFDFFCTPAPPPTGPCDGGPAPKGYYVITGTPGADRLYAGPYKTVVLGLGGNDVLYGGAAADILCGGPGNDKLNGGSAGDYIEGNDGMDWIDGSSGHDRLFGNAGDDYIEGNSGDDFADGGTGQDRVGGGPGTDTGTDPDANTRFVSIEIHPNPEG
jgi:Ca2+-binding RTX toxin-like protein